MKSFSSSSFASDHAVALDLAAEAVRDNPQALFTDFQWFLFEGKDTIFFTAFSRSRFDKTMLEGLVEQMVALAPQLTHGFKGARPGYPFPQPHPRRHHHGRGSRQFRRLSRQVADHQPDVFDRPELPLFRVMAANLKGGPDGEGRASIIQVRSAHCLMEGSDAALLTRSQTANHGIQSDSGNKVSW